MEKGISQLVVLVLMVMITVSLAGALFLWASGTEFDFFPGESIDSNYFKSRACINIESANLTENKVVIKNCGKVTLSEIGIYADGILVYNNTELEIFPQEIISVNITDTGKTEAYLIVVSDFAESPPIKSYG